MLGRQQGEAPSKVAGRGRSAAGSVVLVAPQAQASEMNGYEHRQHGPWHIMFQVMGLGTCTIAAWQALKGRATDGLLIPLVVVGALLLLAAALIGYLDVWDTGDRLTIRFGPLPLMGTSIPYQNIESVESAYPSLLYGYGIHGLPGLFIVFNIWGPDAIRIRLKRRTAIWRAKTVIVGTDEPDRLLEFLRGKIRQQR